MSDKGRLQSFLNFHSGSKKPKKVKRYSFRGKQGKWLSSSMLLQNASGGKALQGIYLTKNLEDQLQTRSQLLEVPQNAAITEAAMQCMYVSKEFSSAHQEDDDIKICELLGHSAAACISLNRPVYGDVTFGNSASEGDATTIYLSTHKFSTLHHASYSFKGSDFTLSSSARGDLGNISKMLQVLKADSPNVQEACKQFFFKYGSHANRGPIRFGIGLWWKCFSQDFENSEIDAVKKMQSNVISNTMGYRLSVGDDDRISEIIIKENYFTNCSKKTRVNTHLVVNLKGGLLKADKGLVADEDTWIVIDRGYKLEAVWDIIKRNHNSELGDVIDVLKTTWENVTGLKAAPNSSLLTVGVQSLQYALETEADLHECTYPQGEPVISRNKSAHDLFKKLSLSKDYPLSQNEALCVRSRPLESSLKKTDPTSLQNLSYLVLHKLMAYDHRCRSDLMSLDSEDEEDSDDNDKKIHPVDSLLAVLISSDNLLRQDLFSRLAKCQLAVPFILPDLLTQQLSIPLWAMRSIIKDFRYIQDGEMKVKTCPVINYEMPIISFIRLGKHQERGVSKSKLLNDVISESHYDHFFNRDCEGGESEVLLGKGLVDMCWYLPSCKPNDMFPEPITFLNLHGDAKEYPQQSRFLSKISFMFFILLTEKDLKFNGETIDILKTFDCITILNDAQKLPEELQSVFPKATIIKMARKNVSKSIQKIIKLNLEVTNRKSLKDHCNNDSTAFLIDEHCGSLKVGLDLATKIQNKVTSYKAKESSTKEELLPLQGDLWQTWALKNKEFYRQTHRGSKLVNIYTDEIKEQKQMLRLSQLKYVESLTSVMDAFIKTLLKYGGPSNKIMRNYFLQCLKLGLCDFSRDHVLALQKQYRSIKIELSQKKYATPAVKELATMEKKNIQKQLTHAQASNVFGLEHLLRELGQIYEAASESSPIPGLSRLPEAAAELLIDGYPLELMDGDAAHVPLRWVTAVITEVATKLKDPKVFVLSVLGLQSSGKSTMLNTVFGLQFNVSSGKCTRGAFMQLLPLDEQLITQTSFSYVLIVDTEGLRTPELDSQKAHKRDSELATFVIGLADVTLINIYGETPGNMDDILQTSVHAFLRMSQVINNYERSCQFVHQNTEPGTNREVVRDNFTQKLNKFTVDAAKEANVEGQYKTFNDVIKFNDTQDIHHFPGLWTGAAPMAHVSQEYSEAAQKLKCHLIEILKKPREGSIPFSSIKHKVSDLWEALLKENFVFSFKNTLEIVAYNSLETEYSQWEWEFREAMLKWEQTQENEITTAELSIVSQLVGEKCEELTKHNNKLYEDYKSEMYKFFNDSKHREMLIQWKERFETKLGSLREELRIHAESQCEKLGIRRAIIARFEEERDRFSKLMTEKVHELLQNLKKEQDELYASLRGGGLEPSQLQKILTFNLFTPEYLKQYRKKDIITEDEEKRILQDSEVPMSEKCLNHILVGGVLSTEQIISILNQGHQSEQELEAKFNSHWNMILSKFPYTPEDTVNVEASIESVLLDYARSYDRYILNETSVRKRGADLNLVVKDNHYDVAVQFEKQATDVYDSSCFSDLSQMHKEAQKITDEVLETARNHVDLKTSLGTEFKPDYVRELLKALDYEIDKHQSFRYGNYIFKFTPRYRFDVYLSACGYAVVEFEKMAVSFCKKNNPRLLLEEEIKGPIFTRFKNQYYQKKAEDGVANSLCAHFEGPIKMQVRKSLSSTIVGQMKNSGCHFKSKMALKVKILTDLYHEDDFDSYMVYVTNVKKCLEEKLQLYTFQYCDEKVPGLNITRLQNMAKGEVLRLTDIIEVAVTEFGGDEMDFFVWLKAFCENVEIKRELGVILKYTDIVSGYDSESIQELNLNNVRSLIKKKLPNLYGMFDGIEYKSEIENWEVKPHEFLMKELVGCTEQCPFCGEQCDLRDPDHEVNHRVAVHRSCCLAGFKDFKTKIMHTEFCTAKISLTTKFRNESTNHEWVDYNKYQRIFPKWTISPDITSEDSLYWMLFIGRYKDQIAEKFNAKLPIVPESWSEICWEEVEENLKNSYRL